MTPLLEAALAVSQWLDRHAWPACVIGGLAVQRWGEPRFTRDVDMTVLVGLGPETAFVDDCLRAFEPARADARSFALQYRVLLLKHSSGVPIDLALGAIPFEAETNRRLGRLGRLAKLDLGGRRRLSSSVCRVRPGTPMGG